MNSNRKKLAIYNNFINIGFYKYPREYTTNIKYETKQLLLNGRNLVNITITHIPEGVSPLANEAVIEENTPKRLHIYSDAPISESQLLELDRLYGRSRFPLQTMNYAIGQQITYPRNNFYLSSDNEVPNSTTTFTEYRYLQKRNIKSNILYNNKTKQVYSLVLPERTMLVIIMPANFVRTGLKSGYFNFDGNLIVRCYSRYILSSELYNSQDTGEVTVFNTRNKRLTNSIKSFFIRLGFHNVQSISDNHIFTFDKYLTFIVGSLNNVLTY